MTPKQKKRLLIVLIVVVASALIAGLVIYAANQNMSAFYSPSEVITKKLEPGRVFRLGGMVSSGSVKREPGSLKVEFEVTDFAKTVAVSYEGVLPDLFREGQGVVTMGRLDQAGVFHADEVLAKHDETYMPPEVAKIMKNKPQPTNESGAAK